MTYFCNKRNKNPCDRLALVFCELGMHALNTCRRAETDFRVLFVLSPHFMAPTTFLKIRETPVTRYPKVRLSQRPD